MLDINDRRQRRSTSSILAQSTMLDVTPAILEVNDDRRQRMIDMERCSIRQPTILDVNDVRRHINDHAIIRTAASRYRSAIPTCKHTAVPHHHT